FRQSHFVDTPYTLGYTLWFLFGGLGELNSFESFKIATNLRSSGPRGRSSVGRALEWHSRGQGFDSPRLHWAAKVSRCFCGHWRARRVTTELISNVTATSESCGNSSVGRAQPCQGWGRGFESRFPLCRGHHHDASLKQVSEMCAAVLTATLHEGG